MSNIPPKLIGLMLSSNNCENGLCYSYMVQACKDTWIKTSPNNVKVYMVYGDTHKSHLLNDLKDNEYIVTEENEIITKTEESRANLLRKTVKAIEYCLDNDPDIDFIFRPNCGSYINTALLSKFLEDKPRNGFYCGINGYFNNIRYSSGACILMSKDVAKLIVDNQTELEYDGNRLMDDVAIGDFLSKRGIDLKSDAMRIDSSSVSELHNSFNKQCYHYYFRHSINPILIYECHNLFMN